MRFTLAEPDLLVPNITPFIQSRIDEDGLPQCLIKFAQIAHEAAFDCFVLNQFRTKNTFLHRVTTKSKPMGVPFWIGHYKKK